MAGLLRRPRAGLPAGGLLRAVCLCAGRYRVLPAPHVAPRLLEAVLPVRARRWQGGPLSAPASDPLCNVPRRHAPAADPRHGTQPVVAAWLRRGLRVAVPLA